MTMTTALKAEMAQQNLTPPTDGGKIIMQNFGDPEPVLDGRSLFEYGYCPLYQNEAGGWYEYPYDIDSVAKLFRATSHHTSALVTKKNVLVSLFKPHAKLTRQAFETMAINLLVFNNAYLQVVRNQLGGILEVKARMARYTRRGVDGRYWHVDWRSGVMPLAYQQGEVLQVFNPDIDQEMYGIPDYLSSVNAILLNEAATLFRRRYYQNGAHAGYILYLSDALTTQSDVDQIEEAVANSKGAGNFKNLFMYVPNGKADGVKVIPLAEVAAKDEFHNIKLASRDDQLAGHRVPPQLMGVVPANASSFGDTRKSAQVFYWHEIHPLQNMLLDLNEKFGDEIISFSDYALMKIE